MFGVGLPCCLRYQANSRGDKAEASPSFLAFILRSSEKMTFIRTHGRVNGILYGRGVGWGVLVPSIVLFTRSQRGTIGQLVAQEFAQSKWTMSYKAAPFRHLGASPNCRAPPAASSDLFPTHFRTFPIPFRRHSPPGPCSVATGNHPSQQAG